MAMSAASSFNESKRLREDDNSTNDKINKLQKTIDGMNAKDAINQQNTFYITSTDPEQAAEEVSRVLQRQIERRKAVWE